MKDVFKDVLRILAIIFCLLNPVVLKQAGAQCDPDNQIASEIEVLKVEARTAILDKAAELGVSVNEENIHFAYSGECTQAKDFTFLANAAVDESPSTRANRGSKKDIAGLVFFESLECVDLNGVFTVEVKTDKEGVPTSADLISDGLKIKNVPVETKEPISPNTPGSLIGFKTFDVKTDVLTRAARETRATPTVCVWCGSITLTYTNFSGYYIMIPVRYY